MRVQRGYKFRPLPPPNERAGIALRSVKLTIGDRGSRLNSGRPRCRTRVCPSVGLRAERMASDRRLPRFGPVAQSSFRQIFFAARFPLDPSSVSRLKTASTPTPYQLLFLTSTFSLNLHNIIYNGYQQRHRPQGMSELFFFSFTALPWCNSW